MNEYPPPEDYRGWVKAMRTDDAMELIQTNPLAYVLLAVIALRSRWKTDGFNPNGLKQGEAFLGDFEEYGMSRRQYRTAVAQLDKWGFATFRPTNKGTLAKLTSTAIFYVVHKENGHQTGQRPATSRPPTGQRPATNEECKTEKSGRSSESNKVSLASAVMNPKARITVELMELCASTLGQNEMAKCHSRWLKRAEEAPSKLRRVLVDTEAANKNGDIQTTPAQYAEHRWKEFT